MYTRKARITLEDNLMSVIKKLSEGNPGAVKVCLDLFQKNAEIDPDNALQGFGTLLALDTHNIYGPRIWMLYKDVCGEDLVAMVAVLRAVQLGYYSDSDLDHAIDNRGKGIDVAALHAQVKKRLPKFADMTVPENT